MSAFLKRTTKKARLKDKPTVAKKAPVKAINDDISDEEYHSKYKPFIAKNFTCFVCGDTTVTGHHITDIKRLPDEKRRRNDRVIPLCHKCHTQIHSMDEEDYYKEVKSFDELIKHSRYVYAQYWASFVWMEK